MADEVVPSAEGSGPPAAVEPTPGADDAAPAPGVDQAAEEVDPATVEVEPPAGESDQAATVDGAESVADQAPTERQSVGAKQPEGAGDVAANDEQAASDAQAPRDEQPKVELTPAERSALKQARKAAQREARKQALFAVQEIRSRIPSWTRALNDVVTEIGSAAPDVTALTILLESGEDAPPKAQATLKDPGALGSHADLLIGGLDEAGLWWNAAKTRLSGDGKDFKTQDLKTLVPLVQRSLAALGRAMQHALYLTFLDDATRAGVGHPYQIYAYCQDWGLTDAQIDELWLWLNQDPLQFGAKKLPLVLDTQNRCVYHTAEKWWKLWGSAAAPLWGGALSFGLVALLFFVLHKAGLTKWPHLWGWKMLILFVFVLIGAVSHIGAQAVNINYDNPIKVYDAGGFGKWLSLRWVGVLQMYIPITFVVAALWGANNIPGSFRALGTAILAGYSADSAFRAAFSSLQGQTTAKQTTTTKTTAATGTSGGMTG